ncbi:hypothetical protein NP493_530g00006 [Ridgeia piscesae]|uniref:Uncharacterized protein n=1 Tax=Ridgeia piscesae TaxID=27915 RepID=A0AAD9KWD0_RIDPI|nr:hypothetical protein NP493_530g00006 [Ridgeia piscesae]
MLANTFGPHKASRRAMWHSPIGKYHNQIDCIMVRKRVWSSVNIAKTRSFPGADIGSDHELHLKRVKKHVHARIKFDLEKLKDPEVAEAFHAMIGGKFAALTILDADGTDMETLINTFNTAVTNTTSEILGKHRPVKKPWVTADLLDLCDKRRELKKKKKDAEGVRQYRAANQEIKKGMKKAKMNWIEEQCQDIEDSMKKNNSKKIAGERPDQHKARANHHHTGQGWKMSD